MRRGTDKGTQILLNSITALASNQVKELELNNFERRLAGYAERYYAYLPGGWWNYLFWVVLPLYALQGSSARKLDGAWLAYGGWALLFGWYFVLSVRVIGKLADIKQKTEAPSLLNAQLSQAEQSILLLATRQYRRGLYGWLHLFLLLTFPLYSWIFVLTPRDAIGTWLVGGLGIILFSCYVAVSARVIHKLSNRTEVKAALAGCNQALAPRSPMYLVSLLAYLLFLPFSLHYAITHMTAVKTSERIFEIGSVNVIFGGTAGFSLLFIGVVAWRLVKEPHRKMVQRVMSLGAGMMLWAFWNLLLVGLITGEIFTAANSFAN